MKDLVFRPLKIRAARGALMALTLCLGIGLSGCIDDGPIETTKAEKLSRDGETVVARVGTSLIYDSDVVRAAKAQKRVKADQLLRPQDPVFQTVLGELVDQRLLKLAAIEQGVERIPEVRRRLEDSRERLLATYFVENHMKTAVTDEALRELYASQSAIRQNADEANIRLIRVKTEAEIKAVAEKLANEADFGDLARELSTEMVSKNNKGELGYVSRVMLDDAIGDVVFATKAGARSKPFETEDGWHIVEVLGFRKPQQASFDAMRPQLLQYKTYAEIDALMKSLREQSEVDILVGAAKATDQAKDENDDE